MPNRNRKAEAERKSIFSKESTSFLLLLVPDHNGNHIYIEAFSIKYIPDVSVVCHISSKVVLNENAK